FTAIGIHITSDPFIFPVVDAFMLERSIQRIICAKLISHNSCIPAYTIFYNTAENPSACLGDCLSFKRPISLQKSDDGLFVPRITLSSLVIFTTDICLIDFNNTSEPRLVRGLFHGFSDSMTKIPSCFITDRQAPLELIGRHALFGFYHKVN